MDITEDITEQFIRGLNHARQLTGVSKRQACKRAGIHESTLYRYMNLETDMLILNMQNICQMGYGMTINKVLALGES